MPRKAATELVKPVDESELDFEVDPNDPLDDVSGAPGREFKLECMDPTRSYAWAHNTREDIATVMASIPGVAWKKEEYAGDDAEYPVRPVGTQGLYEAGESIVKRDHILLSCDKRQHMRRKARRERDRHNDRIKTKREMAKKPDVIVEAPNA